jgi:hypothetical protein
LREPIASLREVADTFGSDEVRDAFDLCLALFDRPGPLDRDGLLRAIRLAYDRMARLMRHAATVREESSEILIALAEKIEPQVRALERTIEALEPPVLS